MLIKYYGFNIVHDNSTLYKHITEHLFRTPDKKSNIKEGDFYGYNNPGFSVWLFYNIPDETGSVEEL